MNTGTWVDTGTGWIHLATGTTDPGAPAAAGFGHTPFGTGTFGG